MENPLPTVVVRNHAYSDDELQQIRGQLAGAGLVADDRPVAHGPVVLLVDRPCQDVLAEIADRGRGGATLVLAMNPRSTHGPRAVFGAESLCGELKSRGVLVHPGPLDGPEQPGFTGGFITRHYGSAGGFDVAAVQLEFGAEYRAAAAREGVAEVVADAIVAHAVTFLGVRRPEAGH